MTDEGEATDDRDWPDPKSGLEIERRTLAVRLGCSLAVFLVFVLLTWGFLLEALPRLWPPTEPLGQWSMLVIMHAFGYVLLPLMVGSVLADLLLKRVLDS